MKRLLALLLCFALPSFAQVAPLQVLPQGSITISATGSSSTTALPAQGNNTVRQLEVQNAGSIVVFVETGISTTTATVATGYPILPGQSKAITVGSVVTHIAVITGSGTQTVYVSVGFGQ